MNMYNWTITTLNFYLYEILSVYNASTYHIENPAKTELFDRKYTLYIVAHVTSFEWVWLCIYINFPPMHSIFQLSGVKFSFIKWNRMWKNNIIACDIQMWRMCEVKIENDYRYFHTEKTLYSNEVEHKILKEKRSTIFIVIVLRKDSLF